MPGNQDFEEKRKTDAHNILCSDFISDIATIKTKIEEILKDIAEIKKDLKSDFVTQKEFWPVKIIVYGFVSIVMASVITAIIMLVVKKGGV